MSEAQVGFLYQLASTLPQNNKSQELLKSYYLLRCKEVTKGYGLPRQQFSSKVRCPYCFLEWSRETNTKLLPLRLSKRQKKRIKSYKPRKQKATNKKNLLRSNQLEQICSLCKHKTVKILLKPQKEKCKESPKDKNRDKEPIQKKIEIQISDKKKLKKPKTDIKNKEINVYSNAADVFSLKNKSNLLTSAIKEPVKIIKNNKRKKDKFAGLCQQAVLSTAKLKERKEKEEREKQEKEEKEKQSKLNLSQNKLNLFLKPSL